MCETNSSEGAKKSEPITRARVFEAFHTGVIGEKDLIFNIMSCLDHESRGEDYTPPDSLEAISERNRTLRELAGPVVEDFLRSQIEDALLAEAIMPPDTEDAPELTAA